MEQTENFKVFALAGNKVMVRYTDPVTDEIKSGVTMMNEKIEEFIQADEPSQETMLWMKNLALNF